MVQAPVFFLGMMSTLYSNSFPKIRFEKGACYPRGCLKGKPKGTDPNWTAFSVATTIHIHHLLLKALLEIRCQSSVCSLFGFSKNQDGFKVVYTALAPRKPTPEMANRNLFCAMEVQTLRSQSRESLCTCVLVPKNIQNQFSPGFLTSNPALRFLE